MNKEILSLSENAVTLLKQKGLTVSSAESCTGGLLSAYITAVSGASSVFEMGVASYSCRIKHKALGVKEKTLEAHGAVSAETAAEMAEGILKVSDADIGLSVTGVAGPDASEGHMPGLVYTAAATADGTTVKELNIKPLGRNYVREIAVCELLKLLIKIIGEIKE